MPKIQLNIPENSKFNSSLNEIDLAIQAALLNQMRLADTRDVNGKIQDTPETYLWDNSRVFQVDELDTIEIFDTYLLRKNINHQKGTNISYPILAFTQKNIDTVFWGTGNRYRQWYLDLEETIPPVADEPVIILEPFKYRGTHGSIASKIGTDTYTIKVGDTVIQEKTNNKTAPVLFKFNQLKFLNGTTKKYKAKAITGTYTATILCDNRDELQYLRDKFILRCSDAQIWYIYNSPTLENHENQIFTVFGIPNIDKLPASSDKLKGKGYIYTASFDIQFWGCLTDIPLPQNIIDTIRMNLHVENDGKVNRIVIA